MHEVALLALIQAKEGKEEEVAALLKNALALADREGATTSWFAFRMDNARFGIFDTFPDEAGRDAHLKGKISAALMSNVTDLLEGPRRFTKPT